MSTTIVKGLTLIETLAQNEAPWSLTDLARQLALPKSNVHFMLSALCAKGYVEQDPLTRRYFLTLRLWELGTRALGRLDLRRIASPFLASLAEMTAETVNLAILDHGEVLYLHKIDSPMPVRGYTPEGRRAPAYCTSTGKAMLAYEPDEVIRQVALQFEPHTDRTIVNVQDLQKELLRIRELGYAMTHGEWSDAVCGVAAPIIGRSGTALAAVGLFGPAERLPDIKLNRMAVLVRETAVTISRALGDARA